MRAIATAALLTLAAGVPGLVACRPAVEEGPAVDLLAAGRQALAVIDGEGLREAVGVLASDEYEGRGPSSAGDEKTQAYLAAALEALGLEGGAADGGWLQRFEIVGVTSRMPDAWTFLGPRSGLTLRRMTDAIAFSGVQDEVAEIESAELVFVGYGIRAPEHDWDDYKGADLAGKVLVMMNDDPDWDENLFAGPRRLWYGRWDYKYEMAAEVGAAGAIIIHTTPSAGYPWQVVQTSWTGEQFELPASTEGSLRLKAWVTEEAARHLVRLGRHDLDELREAARRRDFEPVPLDVITSIRLDNTVRRAATANVLGLLRGRAPEIGREAVVYTAHHDHLGVGEPDASGDTIYNGAVDNASGCAQVLEIAQAFAALPEPPRRSVLFAFVAAEEQGLLGSEHLARHPPVAPGLLAANLNLDGANIWGRTRDVSFIGYGKSSLDAVVEALAAEQGREVVGDQHPDKGYFYRSDQFNLAKIGVPAVYLDTGTRFVDRPEGWGRERMDDYTEHRYHQPSDEISSDWSYDGMVEDARLNFLIGLAVAQSDELPRWNPGDEFEAARLAARAAVEATP
jgi:hypothetical protein